MRFPINYWKGKSDVDLIVNGPNTDPLAINVSYTDEILQYWLNGLQKIKDIFKDYKITLVLLSKDIIEARNEIIIESLW